MGAWSQLRGGGLEPTGRALEPAGRALELAGRVSEQSRRTQSQLGGPAEGPTGRDGKKRKKEGKRDLHSICFIRTSNFFLRLKVLIFGAI